MLPHVLEEKILSWGPNDHMDFLKVRFLLFSVPFAPTVAKTKVLMGMYLCFQATEIFALSSHNVIFHSHGWAQSSGFRIQVYAAVSPGGLMSMALLGFSAPHSQDFLMKCVQSSLSSALVLPRPPYHSPEVMCCDSRRKRRGGGSGHSQVASE